MTVVKRKRNHPEEQSSQPTQTLPKLYGPSIGFEVEQLADWVGSASLVIKRNTQLPKGNTKE